MWLHLRHLEDIVLPYHPHAIVKCGIFYDGLWVAIYRAHVSPVCNGDFIRTYTDDGSIFTMESFEFLYEMYR